MEIKMAIQSLPNILDTLVLLESSLFLASLQLNLMKILAELSNTIFQLSWDCETRQNERLRDFDREKFRYLFFKVNKNRYFYKIQDKELRISWIFR